MTPRKGEGSSGRGLPRGDQSEDTGRTPGGCGDQATDRSAGTLGRFPGPSGLDHLCAFAEQVRQPQDSWYLPLSLCVRATSAHLRKMSVSVHMCVQRGRQSGRGHGTGLYLCACKRISPGGFRPEPLAAAANGPSAPQLPHGGPQSPTHSSISWEADLALWLLFALSIWGKLAPPGAPPFPSHHHPLPALSLC